MGFASFFVGLSEFAAGLDGVWVGGYSLCFDLVIFGHFVWKLEGRSWKLGVRFRI